MTNKEKNDNFDVPLRVEGGGWKRIMISSKKVIIITIALLFCVLIVGYILQLTIEKSVEEDFNKQQLILANQTALTIESVLDHIEHHLMELSSLPRVQRMEPSGLYDMEVMYKYMTELGIIEIARFDANGVLRYKVPQKKAAFLTGNNFSYRKYFQEAKRTGELYISEIITYSETKKGIVIALPVYDTIRDSKNPNLTGKFVGALAAILDLEVFTNKYLKEVKLGRTEFPILLDEDGYILYAGDNKEIVGKNYYMILDEKSIPILQNFISGESGIGYCDRHCHDRETQIGQAVSVGVDVNHLVAYAPVITDNKLWIVAITTPANKAKKIASTAFKMNAFFIALIILIISCGSSILIRMHSRWNKELEREVKQKTKALKTAYEDLKGLDRMKSEFIDIVAHELRTPLTAIKGFTDILLLDREKNLTEKQKDHLKVMNKNVDQLNKLINDMLDLSRIDSGKVELNIESLNLAVIVNSVISDFMPSIENKKQSIKVEVPDNLVIEGDNQKITQIFSKLISNAIKYTPDNGKICLKVEEREDDILVKIRDTGIGIPEKDLERIFERFYLVDAGLIRECDRIGLGLSIAKANVELHAGKIWVESKLGKGSTFGFTLPKKRPISFSPHATQKINHIH